MTRLRRKCQIERGALVTAIFAAINSRRHCALGRIGRVSTSRGSARVRRQDFALAVQGVRAVDQHSIHAFTFAWVDQHVQRRA